MRIMYRYKLNENAKQNEQMIADFKLDKSWKCVYNKQEKLEYFIRTKKNPQGIIDYEELDVDQGNIVVKSSYETFTKKVKKYTRDQLGLMTRPELVKIAEDLYQMNTFGWNEMFLIKRILDEQTKYEEDKDEGVKVRKSRGRKKSDETIPSE